MTLSKLGSLPVMSIWPIHIRSPFEMLKFRSTTASSGCVVGMGFTLANA